MRLGLPAEALVNARKALTLRPGMAEALQTEAGALDALGRPEEAIAVCREVIRRRPKLASAYYDLGSIELHYGRLDEAAQNFRQALALDPRHGEWHRMLSGIVRHKSRDTDIETMQELYGHSAIPENDRMHLAFGLGKALGRYWRARRRVRPPPRRQPAEAGTV